MANPNLYYVFGGKSNRGFRIMWLLEELNQSYQTVDLQLFKLEQRSEAYLKMNPQGKVPTLMHGNRVLSESFAILLYLCEQHQENALLPNDPFQKAKAYEWLAFFMTEIEASLWVYAKHSFVYPPKRRVEGILKTADFEVKRAFKRVSQALKNQKNLILSKDLESSSTWLLGDFSVVDLCAGYLLMWCQVRNLEIEDPLLSSYLDDLKARPAFKRAFDHSSLSWNDNKKIC